MNTEEPRKEEVLPDGAILTEDREMVIESGYDHYWRVHNKAREWAEFGCPICIKLFEK